MVRFQSAILSMIILCCYSSSTAQDSPFYVFSFGSYTTSSKIFHHSSDPDPTLRNEFVPINNIPGGGIEILRSFQTFRLHIGLGIEYVTQNNTTTELNSQPVMVNVKNGYYAIPVELTGYFFLPLDLESIRFFMGGGGGLYFGGRSYSVDGISTEIIRQSPGAGVHVVSGADITLHPAIFLRSSIKFRDINFHSVNRFTDNSPTEELNSRINIDGMTVTVGLLIQL